MNALTRQFVLLMASLVTMNLSRHEDLLPSLSKVHSYHYLASTPRFNQKKRNQYFFRFINFCLSKLPDKNYDKWGQRILQSKKKIRYIWRILQKTNCISRRKLCSIIKSWRKNRSNLLIMLNWMFAFNKRKKLFCFFFKKQQFLFKLFFFLIIV